MVSLTLDGIKTCSNQRQFCLKSPPLLAKPQPKTTLPPEHHLAQPSAVNRKQLSSRMFVCFYIVAVAVLTFSPTESPFQDLLQAEADTNSVSTLLGRQLIRNEKVIEFGQALGVDYNTLKEFTRQAHAHRDPNPYYHVLCETVEHWRKHHPSGIPTWGDVVIALEKAREPNLVTEVEIFLRNQI